MSSSPDTAHENRLARETSPYLLQHKHNPVDWWSWGTEALAEAKRANKPILLSVGYAACHWCHVMAHESFEDPATADVMNELFVNIKVDREERPDIDQIYMSALHHLGEHGGWPLTMFLTPDGEPFWGGTYFPKTARYGKPAFVNLLREVERVFRHEPQSVEQNRSALMARLAESARPAGRVVIAAPELDRAANQIAGMIDPVHGGMRGAPKFPQPMMLEFLWRAGQRMNDKRYYGAVELSLARMCEGGIYDHLGGGFSRYSVDDRWLVPHFEKMLYDNALLLELLAVAYQRSNNELFRSRAHETVAWLTREMTTAGGRLLRIARRRFRGRGGQVLRLVSGRDQRRARQPDDAAYFAAHYDVTAGRQFRGPQHPQSPQALTAQHRGREKARRHARKAARRTRQAGPACARRQGSGRLERADDRRAGRCRPRASTSPHWIAMAARRLPVHRRQRWPMATASAIPGAKASSCCPASPPTTPP